MSPVFPLSDDDEGQQGDPVNQTLLGQVFGGLAAQQSFGGPLNSQSFRNAASQWFNGQVEGQHGGAAAGLIPFFSGGSLSFGTEKPQPIRFGDPIKPEPESQRVGVGLNGVNISQGSGPDQRSLSLGANGVFSFNKPGLGVNLNVNPNNPSIGLQTNAFGGSLSLSGGYQKPSTGFAFAGASNPMNVQPEMDPMKGGGWVKVGFDTRTQPVPEVQSPTVEVPSEPTEAQKFLNEQIAPLVDQYRNSPTSFFR